MVFESHNSLLMECPRIASQASEKFTEWINVALLRNKSSSLKAGLVDVVQGWGELKLRQSIVGTPLNIGGKQFERGLGVHSVSEIVVKLPAPGKTFSAMVGIDMNPATASAMSFHKGSAMFSVDADGKGVFCSQTCHAGDAPVPVTVELDGATEFKLCVLDGGNGIHLAHADWADAQVTLNDGREIYLDDLGILGHGLCDKVPFSFTLDGKSSRDFLSHWRMSRTSEKEKNGRIVHHITYAAPDSNLELHVDVTCFRNYSAVDWVLRFKNTGKGISPLIENIRALDLSMAVGKNEIVFHHSLGSTCSATDFLPINRKIGKEDTQIDLAPVGGRSSNANFPFFNLDCGDCGLIGAIGWSGQWAMQLQRREIGSVSLQAGQQTTHFRLFPGEEVRSPRTALLAWENSDWIAGNNLFRQLVLNHYSPHIDGKIPITPIAQNTWFIFNQGNEVTEVNQTKLIPAMAEAGIEAYWLDAGWFEGGWPAGAGSWVPKKEAFPNGLKPLGDAAHRNGLKFVLWFEPERVTPISRVFKEHPEWVMQLKSGRAGGEFGNLFRLGDPEACRWLTDYLSKCISDWGIDVLRIDFNIDPLLFWEADDEPERRGISEIRYIENLYKMWDELRARHPGLTIDNCASGGRRIDLETIARSYPLWQSDTQCCGHEESVWNQVQNSSLSSYVPLHSGGIWDFNPYAFRSMALTGCNVCRDIGNNPALSREAKKMIAEVKALRPYYLGDYYPLQPVTIDEGDWCGWQYHRPDLDEGVVTLFRRGRAIFVTGLFPLRGLNPASYYEIFMDGQEQPELRSGRSLLDGIEVTIRERPDCFMIRYRKKT